MREEGGVKSEERRGRLEEGGGRGEPGEEVEKNEKAKRIGRWIL